MSDDAFLDGLGLDAIMEGLRREAHEQAGSDKEQLDRLRGALMGAIAFQLTMWATLPPATKALIMSAMESLSDELPRALPEDDASALGLKSTVKGVLKLLEAVDKNLGK